MSKPKVVEVQARVLRITPTHVEIQIGNGTPIWVPYQKP